MSRKITLSIKATVIVTVEEGQEMSDVISNLDIVSDDIIEDVDIHSWNVEDST